jgi:hypothetical protein
VTGTPIRPDDHDVHDRLLVVRFATDDELEPDEAVRARALITGCSDCAALARDIQVISRATASSLTPSRPRDFRLTPEMAAKAHGSPIRRWLAQLASPSVGALRPLAGAAVALGFLLIVGGGGLPGIGAGFTTGSAGTAGPAQASQPGTISAPAPAPVAAGAASPASAPVRDTAGPVPPEVAAAASAAPATASSGAVFAAGTARAGPDVKQTAPQPEASTAPADSALTPAPSETEMVGFAAAASSRPTPEPAAPSAPLPGEGGPSGDSQVSLIGLVIGLTGLVVLLLTWVARRVTKDPLRR